MRVDLERRAGWAVDKAWGTVPRGQDGAPGAAAGIKGSNGEKVEARRVEKTVLVGQGWNDGCDGDPPWQVHHLLDVHFARVPAFESADRACCRHGWVRWKVVVRTLRILIV